MTDQDIKKAAEDFWGAHNTADWGRMGAAVTDNVVFEEPGTQRRVEGRDAVIDIHKEWRRVFPDVIGTIHNTFVSGDQGVAEMTFDGTFRGDMAVPGGAPIPATGKRMEKYRTAFIYRVEDGKLKEARQYFDLMSLMRQLGIKP